jgi:flavin reductase (DIM6/NTAB) family NADH-FMN oxidoreductase RutF
VNLVSHSVAEQMNATSAPFAPDVDEFQRVKLTKEPSQLVAPPAVHEALVNFECKLIQLFQHGNNNLVIGEIIGMRIADQIINDRFHIDAAALDAVGRMGGNWYATTRDRFELRRPNAD